MESPRTKMAAAKYPTEMRPTAPEFSARKQAARAQKKALSTGLRNRMNRASKISAHAAKASKTLNDKEDAAEWWTEGAAETPGRQRMATIRACTNKIKAAGAMVGKLNPRSFRIERKAKLRGIKTPIEWSARSPGALVGCPAEKSPTARSDRKTTKRAKKTRLE